MFYLYEMLEIKLVIWQSYVLQNLFHMVFFVFWLFLLGTGGYDDIFNTFIKQMYQSAPLRLLNLEHTCKSFTLIPINILSVTEAFLSTIQITYQYPGTLLSALVPCLPPLTALNYARVLRVPPSAL